MPIILSSNYHKPTNRTWYVATASAHRAVVALWAWIRSITIYTVITLRAGIASLGSSVVHVGSVSTVLWF